MDKQDLYSLDEALFRQIQGERKKKEAENKAYFDGMEKGAEMMLKAVRDYLTNEQQNGGGEDE